jgi:hypothetical protein
MWTQVKVYTKGGILTAAGILAGAIAIAAVRFVVAKVKVKV